MHDLKNVAVKLIASIAILISLMAIFYFKDSLFLLLFSSSIYLVAIAGLNINNRELFPMLALVLIVRVIEYIVSIIMIDSLALTFLMVSGLTDLLLAFLLVHYHADDFIQKLCKSPPLPFRLPQIHWIALLLGLSCFYRVAASVELMIHTLDPTYFGDGVPFFFHTGHLVTLSLRIAVDLLILIAAVDFNRKKAKSRSSIHQSHL